MKVEQTKKKQISAEIVADSLSPKGHRLTTYVVTFPRMVLAEFNTHRMFSRNSASSRAVPLSKMIKAVQEDPFIPIAWQENHKGMQGNKYLDPDSVATLAAKRAWLRARDNAVIEATELGDEKMANVTKQLCNRLLEPFMWHTAIVTATEYENFFHLRCPQYSMLTSYGTNLHRSRKDYIKNLGFPADPKDYDKWELVDWLSINKGGAEIHISLLAEAMWDAYKENIPKQLKDGDWHIPFGDRIDESRITNHMKIDYHGGKYGELNDKDVKEVIKLKIASARCARVSYINYEGKDDYEADLKLFNRLVVEEPIHVSPVEHCGRCMTDSEYWYWTRQQGKGTEDLEANKGWCGNFRGFIQYRKLFKNENKV